MERLKLLRLHLRLNKQQMAELCGICRHRWYELETGQALPTPALAERLEQVVPGWAIANLAHTLSPRQLRNWVNLRPFELPQVNDESWGRAYSYWRYPISQLNLDERLLDWMRRYLPFASAPEVYSNLQLASLGGRALIANPHQLGFRDGLIVDANGKALGERQLPGLCGQHQGIRWINWPQVHLRPSSTTYCLDGLTWVRKGNQSVWCDLEIDGPRHDQEADEFRATALKIPSIRVPVEQVKLRRTTQIFLERVESILKSPR